MIPLTNLFAAIAVSVITTTNDIPRWTPQQCTDGGFGTWIMHTDEASEPSPVIDAQTGLTNRWMRFASFASMTDQNQNDRVRVIQTKRITSLKFEWRDKQREIVDEEILSESRTRLVLQKSWVEVAGAKK